MHEAFSSWSGTSCNMDEGLVLFKSWSSAPSCLHPGAAGLGLPSGPLTCLPLTFLHPDVAVVLSHARLGVQEGHPDAALGAEASVVAAAVLDGLLVELVPEPEQRRRSGCLEGW